MKKSSELLHKNRTVVKPDKAAMAGNFSTACLLFFSTHYGNSAASCEVFIGGIQNFSISVVATFQMSLTYGIYTGVISI